MARSTPLGGVRRRAAQPEPGDRIIVLCEGGPFISRIVEHPAPFEIEVGSDGMYVLDERKLPFGFEYVYVFVQPI